MEGGADELGRPIVKTITVALMVGERRNVVLGEVLAPDEPLKEDSKHIMWVNLTSTSTQDEIFDVDASIPNGWGLICDGNTIHLQSVRIEIDQGHLTTQRHDMRCELIRESGPYDGEVKLSINGSDDRINYQITNRITWASPNVEETMFSSTVVASSIGGFTLLAAIILFLRKSDSDDEFDEGYEDDGQFIEEELPMKGPPASAFAGPPATVQPVENTMTEYERQVDEYNRKVAEYQAWQATQGSQVVDDTTNHE